MMYSNDMDANPYQQKIQGSQLVSNAGQRQAMTNETQGRVAMKGMERVAGLSAAQICTDQQKSGHVADGNFACQR